MQVPSQFSSLFSVFSSFFHRVLSSKVVCTSFLSMGLSLSISFAQAGVILQGFYWDVPSPSAGNSSAIWWYDRLAGQAKSLRQSGFTAIWLPPMTKCHAGGFSVGYDPFDDYDLGSKNQHGSLSTRYGTREQLQRCIAMMRSNGVDVYADVVLNHRNGDDGNFNFNYMDAFGNPTGGRFQKTAGDFHPNVPQDPNVPLGNQEYTFGRDVAHVNSKSDHAGKGLMVAGDRLTRSLDIQGYRVDYVKGISSDYLKKYFQYGAMRGKFIVGEFYDGDLELLSDWVQKSMENSLSAFDFPLRGLLHDMCAKGGSFDMSRLERAGFVGKDPFRSVTFVENHDTDRSDPVVKGKMLAYAYILTAEGYPSVFYRDYSMDQGCYRLKSRIDPLLFIHEKIAEGKTVTRYKSQDIFAFERTGGKHLLSALSDSPQPQTIRVKTDFGANVLLKDYTNHEKDVRTDNEGYATIIIPVYGDGESYVCYSVAGIQKGFKTQNYRTTQEFFGASDLDIKPAHSDEIVRIGRIWTQPNKPITATLSFQPKNWNSKTRIELELLSSAGKRLAFKTYRANTLQKTIVRGIPTISGWSSFRIRAFNTTEKIPYTLRVNYYAPQTLEGK